MPSAGATADNAHPHSLSRRSEGDRSELDKLDAAVERMKKHTRPDPYIVTIERDKKLQYEHQWKMQQIQWLHGAPFRYDEGEGIQYQTFVFQEPGTNMLSLHAQYYPEERPGTADSTRNATGLHTPAQGPKKVISFGAYKKKQTGETPTRDGHNARDSDKSSKQPAVKGPAERVKALEAESADMLKAVEEEERADASRDTQKSKELLRREQASSKSPELKRKRVGDPIVANKAPETNGHDSARPIKKVKTDAPAPAVNDTKKARLPSPPPEKRTVNRKDDDVESKLPPKLSPLHDVPPKLSPLRNEPHMRSPSRDVPPKLSPLHDAPPSPDTFKMPPRISPDLPDNIVASLQSSEGKRGTGRDSTKIKDEGRSAGVNGDVASKDKNTEQHSNPRARSNSPERRVAQQSSTDAPDSAVNESPEDTHEPADGKKRNSLVAKIKFKKARKEDVQRILKLPARPDKRIALSSTSPTSSDVEDTAEPVSTQKASSQNTSKTTEKTDEPRRSGKGVAQKIGSASKKAEEKRSVSEKRPRAEPTADPTESSETSAKRKRVDDAAELPPKKRQPDVASSQIASKKKAPGALDLKKAPSTPMPPAVPSPAVSSVQKTQLMTPAGRKDHLHLKRDASAESQVDTPSGHSNTPSDRTSQPNGTATKPPSSNPHPAKAATSKAWADEQKRLETVGRDLKHAASDLLNNRPNSTTRRAAAAKSLESLLCYLLAFTCSDRAALVDNKNIPMRSWRSLTPFCSFVAKATQDFAALNGLTSCLAVVIHAHILDIAARYPSEGPSRDSLIELSGALHKAAMAADENLDIDTVITTFPKTWSGRSKSALPALTTAEFGEPRKLLQGGGYRLPLGVQTDALQATRAGLAMVKEWLAKEGVEYDFKLVG